MKRLGWQEEGLRSKGSYKRRQPQPETRAIRCIPTLALEALPGLDKVDEGKDAGETTGEGSQELDWYQLVACTSDTGHISTVEAVCK